MENIRALADNAAKRRGGTMVLHENAKALPLVNDPVISEKVLSSAASVVGQENVVTMPMKLSSEDFSFYVAQKPGAFLRLGTKKAAKGCTTLPHNNDFMIDEQVLYYGVFLQTMLVLNYNGGSLC